MKKSVCFIFFLLWIQFAQAFAQNPLNPFVVEDETLPIANSRFDETVEVPQDNFSSAAKNDMWEKFERGELNGKAYADLQKDYQAKTAKAKVVTGRDLAGVKAQVKKGKGKSLSKTPSKSSKNSKKSRIPQGVPKKLPLKKKTK